MVFLVSRISIRLYALVCLGVTKRIYEGSPLQSAARLSQKQVREISFKLESLKGIFPIEFARQ